MATSLTESVQFRIYREILPRERDFSGPAEKAQGFVELELRRADLFAAKNGGLREIKVDELVPSALSFFRSWTDPYEAGEKDTHNRPEQAFRLCAACHSRGGIYGVNSYTQSSAARPTVALGLFPMGVSDSRSRATEWLTGLKDWTELKTLSGW